MLPLPRPLGYWEKIQKFSLKFDMEMSQNEDDCMFYALCLVLRLLKKWFVQVNRLPGWKERKTGFIRWIRDSSDGIEEYTTSFTVSINDVVPTVTVRTYPNQKSWIMGNIRTELKASVPPATTSEEPSNRQSIKTGLRSNTTTPALTLVGCCRACKLSRITKGNPAARCSVTRKYQTS